jgi:integrase
MSNSKNDRLRYRYTARLRGADGLSEKSIDAALRALSEYEAFTRYRDFRLLHPDLVMAFKEHLQARQSQTHTELLSASTLVHTLRHCRAFFAWLVQQRGHRGMDTSAVEFFRPPRRDQMIARTRPQRRVPTPDDIRKITAAMPTGTGPERRDRAIVAFIFLTGMRADAAASLRLKHAEVAARRIRQDASEVRVKFSKSQVTIFFPIGADVELIVTEWVRELERRGFTPDDPLFPRMQGLQGPRGRTQPPDDFTRECWSNATPIRQAFRRGCEAAGIPYFNPHLVRKTLAQMGMAPDTSIETFAAWSQNLGHEHMLTTLDHYGKLPDERKHEILTRDRKNEGQMSDEVVVGRFVLQRLKPGTVDHARALELMRQPTSAPRVPRGTDSIGSSGRPGDCSLRGCVCFRPAGIGSRVGLARDWPWSSTPL